jgi:hypothetical protein
MDTAVKTLAARIRTALETLGVEVGQARVYDLVAAARGLRNRELLKRPYAMPKAADEAAVRRVAERIDADRADAIARCVCALAAPTVLTCTLVESPRFPVVFAITADELIDPDAFFAGPRAAAAIEAMTRNMYHTTYYRHRGDDSLTIRDANRLADEMLTGKPYEALEDHFGHGASPQESVEQQSDEVDAGLGALRDLADEIGLEFEEDGWREPLEQAMADHLAEDDDSSVEDMIDHQDRAELVFLFCDPELGVDDGIVSRRYRTWEAAHLQMDRSLQFALSRLGYTIGEYRRITGSTEEAHDDLRDDVRPVARTLVTPSELRQLVEEGSGSDHFHFCLYVQARISDLLRIDRAQPITFTDAHVMSYDPNNGCGWIGRKIDSVTVGPEDGELHALGGWYSPSDFCGLVNSCFHGSAKNAETVGEVVSLPSTDQHELPLAA